MESKFFADNISIGVKLGENGSASPFLDLATISRDLATKKLKMQKIFQSRWRLKMQLGLLFWFYMKAEARDYQISV